jgi:DNA-binding transcriptional LysR family regulator
MGSPCCVDLLVSETYEGVAAAPSGGLESHVLLTEELVLVVPADHPVSEPVALETLAGEAWIAGLAGTQFAAALEQACRAAGFTPRVVHRADDATLVHALVRSGLGIALLPTLACSRLAGVRFAEAVPAPPRRRVSALVRRGAASRPALAATLEAMRHRARISPT